MNEEITYSILKKLEDFLMENTTISIIPDLSKFDSKTGRTI